MQGYDELLRPGTPTAYRLCEVGSLSPHFVAHAERRRAADYHVTAVAHTQRREGPSQHPVTYAAIADNVGYLQYLCLATRVFRLFALNLLEAPVQRIETPWRAVVLPAGHPDSVLFVLQHSNQILHCSWQASFLRPADLAVKAFEFGRHALQVTCLAADGEGRRLASGSCDGEVKVWACGPRLEGTESLRLPVHAGNVTALAFLHTDPQLLVTGGDDHYVKLVSLTTGHVCAELVVDVAPVTHIADFHNLYTRERACLAAANTLGKLYVWGLASQQQVYCLRQPAPCAVISFSAPADGPLFAVGTDDGRVVLYDRSNFTVFHQYTVMASVVSCELLRDGPEDASLLVVTATADVFLWPMAQIVADREAVATQLAVAVAGAHNLSSATTAAIAGRPPMTAVPPGDQGTEEEGSGPEEEGEEEPEDGLGGPSPYLWYRPPASQVSPADRLEAVTLTSAVHPAEALPVCPAHLALSGQLEKIEQPPPAARPPRGRPHLPAAPPTGPGSPPDTPGAYLPWWERPAPPAAKAKAKAKKGGPKKRLSAGKVAALSPAQTAAKARPKPQPPPAPQTARQPRGAWAYRLPGVARGPAQPTPPPTAADAGTGTATAPRGPGAERSKSVHFEGPTAGSGLPTPGWGPSPPATPVPPVQPPAPPVPTTAHSTLFADPVPRPSQSHHPLALEGTTGPLPFTPHLPSPATASVLYSDRRPSSTPTSFPISGSLSVASASTADPAPEDSLPAGARYTTITDSGVHLYPPPLASDLLPLDYFPLQHALLETDEDVVGLPGSGRDGGMCSTTTTPDANLPAAEPGTSPAASAGNSPVGGTKADAGHYLFAKYLRPDPGGPLEAEAAPESGGEAYWDPILDVVGGPPLAPDPPADFPAPAGPDSPEAVPQRVLFGADEGESISDEPEPTAAQPPPQPHPQALAAPLPPTHDARPSRTAPSSPSAGSDAVTPLTDARLVHPPQLATPSSRAVPAASPPRRSPPRASPPRRLTDRRRVEAVFGRPADVAEEPPNPLAQPSQHRLQQLQQQHAALEAQRYAPSPPLAAPGADAPTHWNPTAKKLARGVTDYGLHDRRFPPLPASPPLAAPPADGADPLGYRAKPVAKQVTKRWLAEAAAGIALHDHCCPELMPQEIWPARKVRWGSPGEEATPDFPFVCPWDPMARMYEELDNLAETNPARFMLTSLVPTGSLENSHLQSEL